MSDQPTSIIVGPIRPEYVVEPSPWVQPVWPPAEFVADARCPYCSMPLAGTPAIACERGLAHQACVTDG